ncbi:MAG TPA: HD domain-containing phosphohydrolase [Gemmatimonadales bacterium]|nr:HD domain-containing phosphohydrolase [Gemmatimonadales bacterium]
MTTFAPSRPETATQFRMSEILSALSFALDITEGQPQGHSVRTCLIGMRIAQGAAVPLAHRGALFYALLLKDLGCSSNASRLCGLFGADDRALKREHKLTDWSSPLPSLAFALRNAMPEASPMARVLRTASIGAKERGAGREMTQTRCDRGAEIASLLGFTEATQAAIRTLDEHWDGRGMPLGLRGDATPLLGRIVGLAQTVEVFASTFGVEAAMSVAAERRGTWFDPLLVDVVRSFRRDHEFWARVLGPDPRAHLADLEPEEQIRMADDDALDLIAQAFARVIDAKSPYTFLHSEAVADFAMSIGRARGFDADELRTLRRAALLHDIGKLGVSNRILDKPGGLTDVEMAQVRLHPRFTQQILERVTAFEDVVGIASAHHERLDGKGYHRGVDGTQLCALSRALVVADIGEALVADRPYRAGLPWERVLEILRKEAGVAVCRESVEALAAIPR